jgi:morphogenetic protein associated with SpoVID
MGPMSNASVSPLSAAPAAKKTLPNEKPVEKKVNAMNSEYIQSIDLFQQYDTPAVQAMSGMDYSFVEGGNAANSNISPANYGTMGENVPAGKGSWGTAQAQSANNPNAGVEWAPYASTEPVYPYDCPPGMYPAYPVSPYSPYSMGPMWGYGNNPYQGLGENANVSPLSIGPNANVSPLSVGSKKGDVSPMAYSENAEPIAPYSAMPNHPGVAALSAQYPPPGYAGYPTGYPAGYAPAAPLPMWPGYGAQQMPYYGAPGGCGCGGIREDQVNANTMSTFSTPNYLTPDYSSSSSTPKTGAVKPKKKAKKAVIRTVVSKPKPKTTRGSRPWLNR